MGTKDYIKEEILWMGKAYFMGIPKPFTTYILTKDKLYVERGIFTTDYEEMELYRVTDCKVRRTLFQKLFNTGDVYLVSLDKTTPVLELDSIKDPLNVRALISTAIKNQTKRLIELA